MAPLLSRRGVEEGGPRHESPPKSPLTLEQAAERLGVHYMTVYRYVRTGRLQAERKGSRWLVPEAEIERLSQAPGRRAVGTAGAQAESSERLLGRLLAGDGRGSWTVVEDALNAGSATDIYLHVIAPAMYRLGEGWVVGEVSVRQEHQATALVLRIVGRLSSLFARPGRHRPGTVVLAGAAGDPHVLPVTMLVDVVRGEGFSVRDLGADVPASALVEAVTDMTDLLAVGLSLSVDRCAGGVVDAITALTRVNPHVPVLVGGPAVTDRARAIDLGAQQWAGDAAAAAALLVELSDRPAKRSTAGG